MTNSEMKKNSTNAREKNLRQGSSLRQPEETEDALQFSLATPTRTYVKQYVAGGSAEMSTTEPADSALFYHEDIAPGAALSPESKTAVRKKYSRSEMGSNSNNSRTDEKKFPQDSMVNQNAGGPRVMASSDEFVKQGRPRLMMQSDDESGEIKMANQNPEAGPQVMLGSDEFVSMRSDTTPGAVAMMPGDDEKNKRKHLSQKSSKMDYSQTSIKTETPPPPGSIRRNQRLPQNPGALAIPGEGEAEPDDMNPLPAMHHGTSDMSAEPVVATAHLVDEEQEEHPDMVVAVARKDNVFRVLRHDRKSQALAICILVCMVALGVGLGVSLSKSSSDDTSGYGGYVNDQQYLQVGPDINGPDNFFELGPGQDSKFGSSVSTSGDGMQLVVGAPEFDDSQGLVQIYTFELDEWVLQQNIVGTAPRDALGSVVAISLDKAVVAIASPGFDQERGMVQLYDNDIERRPLGQAILGESPGDQFGTSLGLSEDGRRIVIGSMDQDETARVYHLDQGSNEWIQFGNDLISGGNPVSLSADGSTVGMGSVASSENDFMSSVHVYTYDNLKDEWIPKGNEIPLQAAAGSYDTRWTTSLSRNGTIVAIGSGVENGRVRDEEYSLYVETYQFDLNTESWILLGQRLHDKSGTHLISYTVSLSADGLVLAIGDPGGPARGVNAGHVHVLRLQEGEWFHISRELEGTNPGDLFGHAVSVSQDGGRVAVGVPSSRATGATLGLVQVYELSNV